METFVSKMIATECARTHLDTYLHIEYVSEDLAWIAVDCMAGSPRFHRSITPKSDDTRQEPSD